MNQFFPAIDETFLKKERDKARKLRSSQWWKRKRSLGICHYCRHNFLPKELTMDHMIPLARGGKSEKFNLVPCCKECNTKKNQLLPTEWEEYMALIKK
ncbi:MAG: HNH endonuclease [Proteobacteria bacterium]|nr:HNH endonuclease [Pseudomonadota bacterium]MBU1582358.1 HNH endonuclease [Pseudomonadota bacterium]MBU2629198.1 HNH endonuclease [Pseudomonadota bacterium]